MPTFPSVQSASAAAQCGELSELLLAEIKTLHSANSSHLSNVSEVSSGDVASQSSDTELGSAVPAQGAPQVLFAFSEQVIPLMPDRHREIS